MRIISYAGEHFLTTDVIATEVLKYSKVLALNETSDVVNIPVVLDGRVGDADIIIGPASQITSVDAEESDEVDLDDAAALADLRERAARLLDPPAVVSEQPEQKGFVLPDRSQDFD